MTLLRLLLLLAIAGFLVVFTLSNWGATMPLVFLGIPSPALPLSLWVLGAIAVGILTTLLISALFGLTGFTARRSAKRPVSSGSSSAYTQTSPYAKTTEPTRTYPASEPSRSTKATSGDWEDDASDWFDDGGDDWVSEPKQRPPRTDFEVNRNPTASTRSGSSYSYTYRDRERPNPEPPADDSVVDADYRVIVPPRRPADDEFEE